LLVKLPPIEQREFINILVDNASNYKLTKVAETLVNQLEQQTNNEPIATPQNENNTPQNEKELSQSEANTLAQALTELGITPEKLQESIEKEQQNKTAQIIDTMAKLNNMKNYIKEVINRSRGIYG